MNIDFLKNTELPLVIRPTNDCSLTGLLDYFSTSREFLFGKLHEAGALLFRGFNIGTPQAFERLAQAWAPELAHYEGGDSPREKITSNVYTSTSFPPEEHISMHNEKSFSNNYPSLVFFFCEIAPTKGGETPLLDGRRLYNMLDPALIRRFKDKKLKYVMNLHGGHGLGKSWQTCFEQSNPKLVESYLEKIGAAYQWKPDGGLRTEECVMPVIQHPKTGEWAFFSQADQWHPSRWDDETLADLSEIMAEEDFFHHCYYGDGSALDPKDLDQIRAIAGKERVLFPWQKDDFLVVDNLICLHGRQPFEGPRRILVSMA